MSIYLFSLFIYLFTLLNGAISHIHQKNIKIQYSETFHIILVINNDENSCAPFSTLLTKRAIQRMFLEQQTNDV